MRRYNMLTAALLLLGGCTAKEVLITEPVSLDLKIEQVKGSKIVFTVTPGNPDACYAVSVLPANLAEYDMPDREMALYLLSIGADTFRNRKKGGAYEGSFADMWCFRGSRTHRATHLDSDTDHRLLVFQVNPSTQTLIGNVIGLTVRTKPVQMRELSFSYKLNGHVLTITPSDPELPYYWDYDRESRVYGNYNWPYGYFYSLVDMYDQYGFVEKVYSQGPEDYDFSGDWLKDGETYLLTAGACEDGEITSRVSALTLLYKDGKMEIIGESLYPREEI